MRKFYRLGHLDSAAVKDNDEGDQKPQRKQQQQGNFPQRVLFYDFGGIHVGNDKLAKVFFQQGIEIIGKRCDALQQECPRFAESLLPRALKGVKM